MMIRKALETQLRNKCYSVASTGDLEGAHKVLARNSFDLVFLDLRLPDGEGTDLLEGIMAKTDGPMVVMMTGYGSVESAVSCMQMGAFVYVIKPFSFEQIEVVVVDELIILMSLEKHLLNMRELHEKRIKLCS